MKAGVRFDEDTGTFHRRRTVDDVILSSETIAELSTIDMPAYLADRLPE